MNPPASRRRAVRRDPVGAARGLFKQTFGHAPTHMVKAPARLELLGSHAEWNGGLTLSVAIDRHLSLVSAPRTDGRIELVSSAYPERELFWLSDLAANPHAPWTTLIKVVLRELRGRGVNFGGFSAAVHSEIPPGSGLGSSGALMAATALTVRELYPHKLTESGAVVRSVGRDRIPAPTKLDRLRMAALCRSAGQSAAGPAGGVSDVITALCGKEFHAVQADMLHHTVETLPLIGEAGLVLCDTGRVSPILEARTAAIRYHCAAAAVALGVKSLRAVEPSQLKQAKDRMTSRQHAAACHVVGENRRVVAAERSLSGGDLEQFGQYLFHSHASAREYWDSTGPELDLLVDLARTQPACVGARMSGLGFGGCTVNLVQWGEVDEFCTRMEEGFEQATGRKLRTLRCLAVNGAARV